MSSKSSTWWWLIGIGGALGALVWWLHNSGEDLVAEAEDVLARAASVFHSLTDAARTAASTYWPIVRSAAADYGLPAPLILAIMWRESRFGLALSPPGPGGTGDVGHGRGLMQIDDRAFKSWVASNNWQDPETNIRKGAEVLRDAYRYFQNKGYTGTDLWAAAIAAYNAGAAHVYGAIQAGDTADSVTTGGEYATWVLDAAESLKSYGFV